MTVTEKFKNNPIKKQPSMVGVFVNEDINKVLSITKELGFDYIQLSGNESVEYLKEIKKHNKIIKLIKLIRIKNNSLFNKTISDKIQDFKNYADFFLLDTFKNNIYGGTGEPFNWMFVENWGQEIPVILAGGLDSENVAGAIKIVKPFGVDASTRLEKSPGKKDIKKVDLFIKNAASLFL
ncbi:MAG: phosphoribosylanthranilate isomerase [Actinobacteria bacterium]|nr:phosphoribosylanthranilate isomerase [Actinomycetota bacterium]